MADETIGARLLVVTPKACCVCGKIKSPDEFHKDKSKSAGHVATCKVCARLRASSWYRDNPVKAKKSRREWEAAHRVSLNAKRKEWSKNNPDRIIARRQRGKELQKALLKKWLKLNPERRRQHLLANQAKRRGAPGDGFNAADIRELLIAQRFKCAVCDTSVRRKRHVDHVQPLARGGRNDTRNIQILCPRCNSLKAARDPIEFMQSLGRLL